MGVMVSGRLVELADKHTLFGNPQHPYTKMLLDAIPKMHDTGRARTPVQGEVPNPLNPTTGCTWCEAFAFTKLAVDSPSLCISEPTSLCISKP